MLVISSIFCSRVAIRGHDKLVYINRLSRDPSRLSLIADTRGFIGCAMFQKTAPTACIPNKYRVKTGTNIPTVTYLSSLRVHRRSRPAPMDYFISNSASNHVCPTGNTVAELWQVDSHQTAAKALFERNAIWFKFSWYCNKGSALCTR